MNKTRTTFSKYKSRNDMRGFYGAVLKLRAATGRLRANPGSGYGRAYSYYIRQAD